MDEKLLMNRGIEARRNGKNVMNIACAFVMQRYEKMERKCNDQIRSFKTRKYE